MAESLITSETQYREMLRDLKAVSAAGAPLAIDTETTGLRMYLDDQVRGISVAYYTPAEAEERDTWGQAFTDTMRSWYLPVSYPGTKNFSPKRLVAALNRHQGVQAYHNALGVDWSGIAKLDPSFRIPEGRYHDTQVQAWLFDENDDLRLKEGQSTRYFGEDAMAEKRHINALKKGRKRSDIYKELREQDEWRARPAAEARAEAARLSDASKKTWATFTAEDLKDYAARDAELTLMLMDVQVGPFGSDNAALAREHKFQCVLYRMVRRGIRVNPDEALRQWDEAQLRADELGRQFEGVNLNSVPQLRKLIYEDWGVSIKHRTPGGDPSTARAALEELEGHPGVRELMEYRRLSKSISGYYRPLHETIAADGRIHSSFSSTRTVTGRLSSSDPNLQTIPRGDTLEGVRELFVPEPGYELWEYDLDQAELRVQASFSQDPALLRVIEDGVSQHDETARLVFGDDFTGLQRRLAKNLNFGFSYGIGARKFATYMVAGTPDPVTECGYWQWDRFFDDPPRPRRCSKCHVCQAAAILDANKRAYPRLVQLMSGLERIARADGLIPLHVEGRYRHFRSPGKLVHYYTALNAVVQGGIAEFAKDMMIESEAELAALGARLCIQVHDSFVVEVPPGLGPKVAEMLQRIADDINPFDVRMLWTSAPWSDHD